MRTTFTLTARVAAPLCALLLAACGQQPAANPTAAAAAPATAPAAATAADPCATNAAVAVDFVNLYAKHLRSNEQAAEPQDTYEWLKASSLVDATVASAYAATDLVDGDPILNAQDFPEKFALASCPGTPGLVEVKGVGEPAIMVPVKVSDVGGKLKVVGVGTLNMATTTAAETAPTVVAAASATTVAGAKWREGFGQGNLEYLIEGEGVTLLIGCPTQDGSADAKSSVSLFRSTNMQEISAFTVTADGLTFEGPFEADSRVGDNNFTALLEALHETNATVKFEGRTIIFPKSNAATVVPTFGSPNFSCNMS